MDTRFFGLPRSYGSQHRDLRQSRPQQFQKPKPINLKQFRYPVPQIKQHERRNRGKVFLQVKKIFTKNIKNI